MQLYEHQKKIVRLNPKKYGLWWGVGTGKTYGALALAQHNAVTTLIVVPKSVRKKWHDAMIDAGVDGMVISREQFRKLSPTLPKYEALIIDESHFAFSNIKSQMHKATQAYIKKWEIEYVWLLTGTVYTSSPWSIYGQAMLLGHTWNYHAYRNEFFYEQWFGRRSVWVPRSDKQDELADMARRIGDVVRLDECVDIPPQTYEIERFEKTKEQEKAEKYVMENEPHPLVRTTKYHQIASGIQIGNEFEDHKFFDADKNERILSYADEVDKLVVFSRYNIHLDFLSVCLKEKDIPHAIINGTVDDKEAIIALAEKSPRFVLLINTQCSVGYELPSFRTMIFASLSFSYVDYAQAQARNLRINNMQKNLYVIMITDGTVDEDVWNSIKNKESFNEAIFSNKIQEYEQRNIQR